MDNVIDFSKAIKDIEMDMSCTVSLEYRRNEIFYSICGVRESRRNLEALADAFEGAAADMRRRAPFIL